MPPSIQEPSLLGDSCGVALLNHLGSLGDHASGSSKDRGCLAVRLRERADRWGPEKSEERPHGRGIGVNEFGNFRMGFGRRIGVDLTLERGQGCRAAGVSDAPGVWVLVF